MSNSRNDYRAADIQLLGFVAFEGFVGALVAIISGCALTLTQDRQRLRSR